MGVVFVSVWNDLHGICCVHNNLTLSTLLLPVYEGNFGVEPTE